MGRLIDIDEVKKRYPIMENDFGMVVNESLHEELDKIPSVEAISKADMVVIFDKIRAEIDEYGSIMVAYAITEDTKTDKGIEKLVSGVLKEAKKQVLEIIDKYKTERREISMNKNPIDKYHAIKLIIDTAEEKIQGEFEECVQNNWMYDYTQFANNTRMQAYNEIEKMTKE